MDRVAQEREVSKLLAVAGNVKLSNSRYKRALESKDQELEKREYGRLNKNIQHLTETAEVVRKSGAAGESGQP